METSSQSQPSSPGVSPVQLEDCIEELVRFTLQSSVRGKIQIGLSPQYCAELLETKENHSLLRSTNDDFEGVPSYPLYKRLAASLYPSIQSGGLTATVYEERTPSQQEWPSKTEDDELNKMIVEKGHALLNMLEEVDFELHVQEPFLWQLNDGTKKIEGRCAVGDYKRIESGNILLFNKCLTLQVQGVRHYASFHDMLEAEGLFNVLPGALNIDEGVGIYRNFYSEEKERSNGVLAISVKAPTSQLHLSMASFLSGLSYGGVQRLLGFVETAGTQPELLPPPPSTLLSAFLEPHNPNVKGSTLTSGARALAKHVNRCREGYWGAMYGSDTDKNEHAEDVITRLLTECCWMNMHIVPPHGNVFEIRNIGGYGARWSGDGAKFIGFLEPYMVNGHMKRWKH